MTNITCGNAECDKTVTQSARGRSRKYCSPSCRLAAFRAETKCKSSNGTDLQQEAISLQAKSTAYEGQKADLEKANLSWVEVNDVTWKLTDGSISRTPASHGQWGGYDTERALAWVMDAGWVTRSKVHYFARCGKRSYGPTNLADAKKAALAMVTGAPFEPTGEAHAFTGNVNLNGVAR